MPFQRFIKLIHCHPIQFAPAALFHAWTFTSGILSFCFSVYIDILPNAAVIEQIELKACWLWQEVVWLAANLVKLVNLVSY